MSKSTDQYKQNYKQETYRKDKRTEAEKNFRKARKKVEKLEDERKRKLENEWYLQ